MGDKPYRPTVRVSTEVGEEWQEIAKLEGFKSVPEWLTSLATRRAAKVRSEMDRGEFFLRDGAVILKCELQPGKVDSGMDR